MNTLKLNWTTAEAFTIRHHVVLSYIDTTARHRHVYTSISTGLISLTIVNTGRV